MIKVLITDDHPIVRQGIKQVLEDCHDIEVLDEVGEGNELIKKIIDNEYDVILLDISLPGRNGLDLLKEIKSLKPKLYVLMLSMHPEEQYAIRALKLGASGYLTKASVSDELISAIRKAAQGKKYITPSLAEKLAFNIDIDSDKPLHYSLSDRELEVMCLLAQGKTLSDIANELSLSSKTISTYRERIMEKMGIKNTAGIIRYAIKNKLVE